MCLSLNKTVLGLIITNINFIISYCTKEKEERKRKEREEKCNHMAISYHT